MAKPGHGSKLVTPYLSRRNQFVHEVTQVPLVLCLMLKPLAAHFHDILLRVIPGPGEFLELQLLGLGKTRNVLWTKLDHHFPVGRMELAHVCCVSEPQNLLFGGWLEGLGQFWSPVSLPAPVQGQNTLEAYSREAASPTRQCVRTL